MYPCAKSAKAEFRQRYIYTQWTHDRRSKNNFSFSLGQQRLYYIMDLK
jgi:hypothetical protein